MALLVLEREKSALQPVSSAVQGFLFGTEIGVGQLKISPCTIIQYNTVILRITWKLIVSRCAVRGHWHIGGASRGCQDFKISVLLYFLYSLYFLCMHSKLFCGISSSNSSLYLGEHVNAMLDPVQTRPHLHFLTCWTSLHGPLIIIKEKPSSPSHHNHHDDFIVIQVVGYCILGGITFEHLEGENELDVSYL